MNRKSRRWPSRLALLCLGACLGATGCVRDDEKLAEGGQLLVRHDPVRKVTCFGTTYHGGGLFCMTDAAIAAGGGVP